MKVFNDSTDTSIQNPVIVSTRKTVNIPDNGMKNGVSGIVPKVSPTMPPEVDTINTIIENLNNQQSSIVVQSVKKNDPKLNPGLRVGSRVNR
eukprot:UN26025